MFRLGNQFKEGQFIVKNCMSDLHAKVKLEKHLRKTYNFDEMNATAKVYDDIFKAFGNIFGKNWFQ